MRAEPFRLALATLRENLRAGRYPPGERLAATLIAADLRLSATPVREALSRLAGEGLLEDRRGQGFFVRALRGDDVADLYRLHQAVLRIVLDPRPAIFHLPPQGEGVDEASPTSIDPVARVEQLFASWVAQAGSQALQETHQRLLVQLGPARRLEPLLIPDLGVEAEALEAEPADPKRRGALVRRFHARRIQLADRLAALAERRPRPNY